MAAPASAALDDAAHAFELLAVGGPDAEFACRPFGDDVDGLAAVRDVAMHADAVAEVNPLPVDEPEGVEACRESAGPGVRCRGGMGGRPAELEHQPERGQGRVHEQIAIEGVKHHGGVDAVEDARLDHLDLATPALLGWGPEENDVSTDRIGHRGRSDERAGRRSRDEVVPARVPDAGKGVVLGEDRGARSPRTLRVRTSRVAGAKSGRHSCHPALDRVPSFGEEVREPSAGLVLLESELWVCVDAARQGEQLARARVDGAIDGAADVRSESHGRWTSRFADNRRTRQTRPPAVDGRR